jgi:S1-C subfamily serine protease
MQTNNVFLGICCAPRQPLHGQAYGALVTRIDERSPAIEAGLQVGDVILEIDNQAVKSPEHAAELGKTKRRGAVLLRVWTAGKSRYFVIESCDR